MYAIHSLLRRMASTVIYAEQPSHRLPGMQQVLAVTKGRWIKAKSLEVVELRVTAPTSAQAAQKLSLRENEIAKKIGAEDRRYTLILGPESEQVLDDGVERITRIAVVNGIFRYRGGLVERLRRRTPGGKVSRKRHCPPPGAAVENR